MQMNPYLMFNGTCAAAFKFYAECLGGRIEMMLTHGESPVADQTPPEMRDAIMHARLTAGGNVLMGSDVPPAHYHAPAGFSVSVSVADPADADRIFQTLSENGTVHMPIGETFWALRFGMFVDQFGIPWMVNCEKPASAAAGG